MRDGQANARRAHRRVLVMISALGGGGAERVATRLASMLAERGDEVFIMPFSSTERPYPLSDKVHVIDCSLYDLRKRRPQPWQALRTLLTAARTFPRLVALRRDERIDVTVSMLLAPNILNVVAGGPCRKVLCERNNPSRKGAVRFALSKWVYRHGDCVVFQTEHVRSLFSRRVQERGVIIPNPVTVACRASGAARPFVACAGRLVRQKNHTLLLRAFALFLETHPGYELRIFGDGSLGDELADLAASLGVDQSVRLMGFRDDVHEQMADARMFVLSSDYEGMPNALLEAMTMGLPCISTDYPAAREVLGDGRDGLLVPTGDVTALAKAMGRVADDEGLRRRLSEGALSRSRDFSPDVVIPLWEAVL